MIDSLRSRPEDQLRWLPKLKAMNLEHVMVIADRSTRTLFLAARNLANVLVAEPRYADPLSLVFYKRSSSPRRDRQDAEMFA